MHAWWLSLFCLEHVINLAGASLLHQRLARNAEKHTAFRKAKVARGGAEAIPDISVVNAPPRTGISAHTPESPENLKGYNMAQPTPQPAALSGEYCKGGACQYRVAPLTETLPPLVTPTPLLVGGNTLSGHEFCRGMGCVSAMGVPHDSALASFNVNCSHLFNDVGGGLLGSDADRSVPQVHSSFQHVCERRVGPLEAGACPTYANTLVGAVSSKVDKPTVGSTTEVCTDLYVWLISFKQAEIDLKLTSAALPKGSSLLAGDLNRFGTGGVGPDSPRGRKWQQYVMQQGLPKYVQNPPSDIHGKNVVKQSSTQYQIAPGSLDGTVPPVEVSGNLFSYCTNQFSEIMLGFAQTAPATVKLTKSWCAWQASVSSWVDKVQEYGHPDWSHRSCSGMEILVAFALQDRLADHKGGLSSQQVCKEIFLSIDSVHRTEGIVKEAWQSSLRGPPRSGIPSEDDSEMKSLLKETQDHARKIFQKLRGQKAAYESLNAKKMEATAFDLNGAQADVDPTTLLAVSVQRVRQSKRLGTAIGDSLDHWGRGI